jgi:hypothetical protein
MRQKVDIGELEESTKIRAKYLRALENEEFGLLPGPTYVKSFLRTYAEKLGLDPQLLVEEFRAQYEPPEPLEFQPLASPPRDARRRHGRPPRPRVGPGAAIVLAALALLGFLLVLGLTGDEDEPATKVDTGPAEPAAPKKPKRRETAPAPANRVTVRVEPVDATYVCLDDGAGTVVFEGILDGPRTFRARDTLRINLGKRSARLLANRRPVRFAAGPDPVGFRFTRAGARTELAEGERPCA